MLAGLILVAEGYRRLTPAMQFQVLAAATAPASLYHGRSMAGCQPVNKAHGTAIIYAFIIAIGYMEHFTGFTDMYRRFRRCADDAIYALAFH
jgi:hypothetical protein